MLQNVFLHDNFLKELNQSKSKIQFTFSLDFLKVFLLVHMIAVKKKKNYNPALYVNVFRQKHD